MKTRYQEIAIKAKSWAAILSLLFAVCACTENQSHQPGLCLSFDDHSVKEWFALRPLFNRFDAKVTFYISDFETLDSDEVQMLKTLEADGHEVGFHGSTHVLARDYILKNGYQKFLSDEINRGAEAMHRAGFNPRSFAYPFGQGFPFTDYLLLKKFKTVRRVTTAKSGINLSRINNIFYHFDGDRTLSALDIDAIYGLKDHQIIKALAAAKNRGAVLMLLAHKPFDGVKTATYQIDVVWLEKLFMAAKKHKLRFYRVGDLREDLVPRPFVERIFD